MSTEQNKQLAKRVFDEVLNGRNLSVLDELAVTDYEEHSPLPGQRTGLDGLKDRYGMLLDAMDVRFTIEDLIAEGDRVVLRWSNQGKQVGEFMGIPANGKSFSTRGIEIWRVQDGRLAEHWDVVDVLSQLMQLGVFPQPQETSK